MVPRCPQCCSEEVQVNPEGPPDARRCGNCSARFTREEALLSVGEAEALRGTEPAPRELFDLDRARALASINDPDGELWPVNAFSDVDELEGLLRAAREADVIGCEEAGADLHVYPLSLSDPDPLVAVGRPGVPTLLGHGLGLREREGENPVEFTLRFLEEVIAQANALATSRQPDSASLDRIATYMNRPGPWSGADVCEFVAQELARSGRQLLDNAEG